MVVPLRTEGQVYGTISLVSDDPNRIYGAFDLTMATEFARRGGIAIAHSRLFEREHFVATTLQRALLPAVLPQIEHVRLYSAYASAVTGEEVGGDWYDAFSLGTDTLALSIGDVAGHGVSAAVIMSAMRQAIRTAAIEAIEPHAVLERANAVLALNGHETMVTALFATLDLRTRRLRFASAGHPAPLVVDGRGHVDALNVEGTPLGALFDTALTRTSETILDPTATIVLFTDGLLEFDRDIFRAERRLTDALRRRSFLVAENPASAIIGAVVDAAQKDDISVLVVMLE